MLSDVEIPIKALYCKDSNCTEHNIEFKSIYNQIVSAVKIATQKCIPTTISSAKFKIIPGWKEYVKERHDIARDAFHWWTFNNRPRYGLIYHSMRTSGTLFKYALRYPKSIEETPRADYLASDIFDKKIMFFGLMKRGLSRAELFYQIALMMYLGNLAYRTFG